MKFCDAAPPDCLTDVEEVDKSVSLLLMRTLSVVGEFGSMLTMPLLCPLFPSALTEVFGPSVSVPSPEH
jgi:hypothetical protein